MLSVIIFAVCVGLSSQQLPNSHELAVLVDQYFNSIDTDNNGVLSLAELTKLSAADDLNGDEIWPPQDTIFSGDGQITLAEYAKFTNATETVAKPLFDAYDRDGDGILPLDHLSEYLHFMDKNHDGQVDLQEYEHYQVKLIQCVYSDHGHGSHGHAASCATAH